MTPTHFDVAVVTTRASRRIAELVLSYREAADGQILEEGITEAGSLASFTAAATAYATWGEPLIPFFVFYSMFGFQRVADLIWSFGDQMGRGFLCGATAGRTTLAGEGLQHCDGQSHLFAMAFPDCRAYDPAFAYELAVIVRDGIERMYGPGAEGGFWYLTLYNENIEQPPMPPGVEAGIVAGCYLLSGTPEPAGARVLASGPMVREALVAQRRLAEDHGLAVEVWSAPGWKQLRDDALACERWNRLHPGSARRVPYVTECLSGSTAPVVAVSDWVRGVPDAIARFVPARYHVLGTDGYGCSDVRPALRRRFEVDAAHIDVAVLAALAEEGTVAPHVVSEAIAAAGIDPAAVDPARG
ncbi:MAG: transketolase-like TK C-terminal-containing protein [Actinomycetota bacterium]